MSPPIELPGLKALVDDCDLGGVLGTEAELEFAARRLSEFFTRYGEHRRQHRTASSLPLLQDWTAMVRQSKANLHRVRVLLQAVAFMCSAEMLAMLWMVQLGASVKELHVDHERDDFTKVRVVIGLPGDEEATEAFESTEHWDLALFQFVTISKVNNEQPVVEGFFALKLPGE